MTGRWVLACRCGDDDYRELCKYNLSQHIRNCVSYSEFAIFLWGTRVDCLLQRVVEGENLGNTVVFNTNATFFPRLIYIILALSPTDTRTMKGNLLGLKNSNSVTQHIIFSFDVVVCTNTVSSLQTTNIWFCVIWEPLELSRSFRYRFD